MEDAEEQGNSRVPAAIRKYAFKKGVSGNPGGRKPGSKSLKTFAREYLENMDEEDRIIFLNSLDPKTVWEMSEGKPKQDTDITSNGNELQPVMVRFLNGTEGN